MAGFSALVVDRLPKWMTWRLVVESVGVVALFVSAIQIFQAAQIQQDSVSLQERLTMGQLSLEAHAIAYEFLAAVGLESLKYEDSDPDSPERQRINTIPEPVRIAGLKLQGALSRARIVDDKLLVVCLDDIDLLASLLMNELKDRKDISVKKSQEALDGFAHLVSLYVAGREYPIAWRNKPNTVYFSCPFFGDLEPNAVKG